MALHTYGHTATEISDVNYWNNWHFLLVPMAAINGIRHFPSKIMSSYVTTASFNWDQCNNIGANEIQPLERVPMACTKFGLLHINKFRFSRYI